MASPGSQAKERQANKPGGAPGKQTDSGGGGYLNSDSLSKIGAKVSKATDPARVSMRPEGGSATSWEAEPGSVQNYPNADSLTVFEKVFAPLAPGVGAGLAAAEAGKLLDDDDSTNFGDGKTVLGGDPGPQSGWQRDRGKGASSFNPNDPRGTDSREIPGTSYGAGTQALTGDSDETVGAGTDMLFSDVTLRDRRKAKNYGAGTEMVLGA